MKRTLLSAALFAAIAFSIGPAQAANFSYHGNLQDAGKPAEGNYDLELTLYSAAEGGHVIAGPLLMYKVPVHNGTFSTEADFGPSAQAGTGSWLAVKVRNAGNGEFAALSARAPIGADATAVNGGCPGSWSLDGNAGNIAGSYLGTTDAQPLVLQTGGQQIVRTDLIGGGTVPRWIGGGSLNGSSTGSPGGFIGGGGSSTSSAQRNQVGTFSVVGGGAQNSAGYTAANGYSTICGGDNNTANINYATIGGGDANTITTDFATIGGGLLNTASGVGATVPGGTNNTASGKNSFAAGTGALAGDNSFVWSDGYGATPFGSTSAVNQFDVKASGGVAINGAPKNSEVELSIYPGASGQYNYSSLFMGDKGDIGGMLISVGDESSSTSNDAAFYIDQFDGTHQTRKLILNTDGLSINRQNTVDTTSHPALSITSGPNSPASEVNTDYIPGDGSNGYIQMYAYALPGSSGKGLEFDAFDAQGGSYSLMITGVTSGVSSTEVGVLYVGGVFFGGPQDLTVTGNAYKPGGGTWSVGSDRRIKQDIAPIQDALDTVMKLRPVNFHYTPEYRAMEGGLPDKSYAGFIAQEYAEVFPADVVSTRDHVPGAPDSDPPILALDPNSALINTVAAVQELAVENTALHKQIDELVARLNKLESKRGE